MLVMYVKLAHGVAMIRCAHMYQISVKKRIDFVIAFKT